MRDGSLQGEARDDVLLDVRHLSTSFFTPKGVVEAVKDVSYYVSRGEIVAIVGESGCGKSVTQMSVIQLVQTPPGKIVGGEVFFKGQDLLKLHRNSKEMEMIRGAQISMIFQSPMTALNPVIYVGEQLAEVIRVHEKGLSKKDAWEKGVHALESVGIPDARARMRNYPFEMSGGMRQRALIALSIACGSDLIIADEPTTALDVTIQAQVMELLQKIVAEYHKSLVMVTHNLGLVSRYADRIYVMYAGSIVESGTCESILTEPKHPYTKGLIASVPSMDRSRKERLIPIKGAPPSLMGLPDKCTFLPRCDFACESCQTACRPVLRAVGGQDHYVACHRDV